MREFCFEQFFNSATCNLSGGEPRPGQAKAYSVFRSCPSFARNRLHELGRPRRKPDVQRHISLRRRVRRQAAEHAGLAAPASRSPCSDRNGAPPPRCRDRGGNGLRRCSLGNSAFHRYHAFTISCGGYTLGPPILWLSSPLSASAWSRIVSASSRRRGAREQRLRNYFAKIRCDARCLLIRRAHDDRLKSVSHPSRSSAIPRRPINQVWMARQRSLSPKSSSVSTSPIPNICAQRFAVTRCRIALHQPLRDAKADGASVATCETPPESPRRPYQQVEIAFVKQSCDTTFVSANSRMIGNYSGDGVSCFLHRFDCRRIPPWPPRIAGLSIIRSFDQRPLIRRSRQNQRSPARGLAKRIRSAPDGAAQSCDASRNSDQRP